MIQINIIEKDAQMAYAAIHSYMSDPDNKDSAMEIGYQTDDEEFKRIYASLEGQYRLSAMLYFGGKQMGLESAMYAKGEAFKAMPEFMEAMKINLTAELERQAVAKG